MKTYVPILTLYLTIFITTPIFSQSDIKIWTESTDSEFSDNQLTNVIINSDSSSGVQLEYPLKKTVNDYIDNSYYRYTATDSNGNFVKAWVTNGNVYAQKYAADGKELSKTIKVYGGNAVAGIAGRMVAILNNGSYIVVWSCPPLGYEKLFGQVIINDSIKSGNYFQINNNRNAGTCCYNAYPIANNRNNCFELFLSLRTEDGAKIYRQIRDLYGNMVGEDQLLNKENITQLELVPKIIGNEDGFWALWNGDSWDDEQNSTYIRHYKNDGTPITDPIQIYPKSYLSISFCMDKQSHVFIVWLEPTFNGNNAYGQLYDSNGVKIGNSFRLNSLLPNGNNQDISIELVNNEFQISWLGEYQTYINRWKFEPQLVGDMISSVFDGSPRGCIFKEISWNYKSNLCSDLKFRIRSGNTIEQLNNSEWYGPTSNSDFYTIDTGQAINNIHDNNRYIQYRAYFSSEYGNSAELTEVNIKYSPNDNISPKPPLNLNASNNHIHIFLEWQKNTDEDVATYKIYRGVQSQQYDKDWSRILSKDLVSYTDSSALIGKKYYYVITAIDSSHNESYFSNEVPMMFSGLNFYVSENGNSNGSGSIDDPVKTIKQGMALASSGDTLRIMPGNYRDDFEYKYRVSLIGAGADQCYLNTEIYPSDDCIIKGFTITGSIYCEQGKPIISENIINCSGNAISLGVSAPIESNSSSAVIVKNFITGCTNGIIAQNNVAKPVIKNNIITSKDIGINIIYGKNPEIINNTIITSSNTGISIYMSAQIPCRVENNILVSQLGINSINDLAPVFNYNNAWKGTAANLQLLSTNISVNPLFINDDIRDYHLISISLCKNAGNPDQNFNDADGTRNDIGAYGGPDPFNIDITSQRSRSISVSSISGYPGDTVSVLVVLNKTDALAKAHFKIGFDNSVLSFLNAKLTDATINFGMTYNLLSSNSVEFSLASTGSAVNNLKDILRISFVINQNSKSYDASPITINDILLSDSDSKEIIVNSITNGAFGVSNTIGSTNNIYVDCSNLGIQDGTRKKPYKTITAAIDAAIAGDTIWVAGGNYKEVLTMKEGVSVIGSGSSVTTFTGTGEYYGILFDNVSNGEISGFTFKSDETHLFMSSFIICRSSSPIIKKNRFEADLEQKIAILCEDSSNVIFENNYLKNMDVMIDGSNPEITNNYIEGYFQGICCYNNSNPVISGNTISAIISEIFVRKAQAIIKNNFINRLYSGNGIFIDKSSGTKVYNNIINAKSGITNTIKINESQNVDIINNTIVAKFTGIEETSSTANIMNNIIINGSEYGVSHSSYSYVDYNNFWNNTVNCTEPNGSNNIYSEIMFADTSKGNYMLHANSPCINAGNPAVEYNDIDGSRNDIGAYGGPYADFDWMDQKASCFTTDQLTRIDTIQIVINGENVKGIAGLNLELAYDPDVLSLVSVNSSNLTKSFSVENTNYKEGIISISLNSSKGIKEENGELIELKFVAHSSQYSTTTLYFKNATAWDETTILKNISQLEDCMLNIITDVDKTENKLLTSYSLFQNYPNPFNPVTKLRYELPYDSKVIIKIYDILGRLVRTLINKTQVAGSYEIEWNASRYASGIYIYKISANDVLQGSKHSFTQVKKMILLK